MGITRQTMSTHDSRTTEYIIYTFQRGGNDNKGPEHWQKQQTHRLLPEAIEAAETLYESGQYSKVEVKEKYADPKNGQITDSLLRTFKEKEKRSFKAAMVAVLAMIFGGIAFTVTYYLGQS